MDPVGIDLGTTNSLVAVMRPDGPETLANELGEHLTPSVVALAADGTLLVGRAAKDRLAVDPEAGQAFFKRDMGSQETYRFGGRSWTPTECSAHVLRELKRLAQVRLGRPVESAVVTVPAYFRDPQRQATIEAAKIAGLSVERILNEPTSAALAFGSRAPDTDRRVIVLDLGGGTFDVTVLELFGGIVEVRASGGDGRLGGEDFTDALLAMALARAGVEPVPAQQARWRQRIEVAKRALSTAERVDVDLDGRTVALTSRDFETATAGLLARLRPIVRRCLSDAGLAAKDLDDVLLVGGATRMPSVRAFAAEELGRLPNRSLDPDRVVALGAAVQAARIAGSADVADVVLTDVCPHTLGVEVAKSFGRMRDAGLFSPILDRNVTIPASRAERYHTLDPTQDRLSIRVFQGESRRVTENTLLGELELSGLRHRPGQRYPGEVDVRFTYDVNGVLEVEVTVLSSKRRVSHVIQSRPGALTPAQVEEAVRRMQPLKVHPRDLLPNRARLERAHRLYEEWTGLRRADLSGRIDAFESALESGTPEEVGFATALLDAALADAYEQEGEERRDETTARPDGSTSDSDP